MPRKADIRVHSPVGCWDRPAQSRQEEEGMDELRERGTSYPPMSLKPSLVLEPIRNSKLVQQMELSNISPSSTIISPSDLS